MKVDESLLVGLLSAHILRNVEIKSLHGEKVEGTEG
jgi:hypothetical protein